MGRSRIRGGNGGRERGMVVVMRGWMVMERDKISLSSRMARGRVILWRKQWDGMIMLVKENATRIHLFVA